MARADSTIRVNIIGDAKGLSKELGKTDKALGGLGKKLVAGLAVGVVTDQLLDFGQTALNEADRAGDALTRLNLKLGPLAQGLDESAEGFHKLGQSRQDMLELEAAFADMATALGVGAPFIAEWADDAAATAAALELLGKGDAAGNIELIGKAAQGSDKAMRALGINIDEAAVAQKAMEMTGKNIPDQLTDSEKAAARYLVILDLLKPSLDAVAAGSGDVERKQADLEARFETLTGRLGEHLEGPLNDFLDWTLHGIDGLERLGEFIDIFGTNLGVVLGPLGSVVDLLADMANLIARITGLGGIPSGGTTFPVIPNRPGVSGGTGGTSSQRNVVNAVQDYQERNGRPII